MLLISPPCRCTLRLTTKRALYDKSYTTRVTLSVIYTCHKKEETPLSKSACHEGLAPPHTQAGVLTPWQAPPRH